MLYEQAKSRAKPSERNGGTIDIESLCDEGASNEMTEYCTMMEGLESTVGRIRARSSIQGQQIGQGVIGTGRGRGKVKAEAVTDESSAAWPQLPHGGEAGHCIREGWSRGAARS